MKLSKQGRLIETGSQKAQTAKRKFSRVDTDADDDTRALKLLKSLIDKTSSLHTKNTE
jgi:hypothetical protein